MIGTRGRSRASYSKENPCLAMRTCSSNHKMHVYQGPIVVACVWNYSWMVPITTRVLDKHKTVQADDELIRYIENRKLRSICMARSRSEPRSEVNLYTSIGQ